MSDTATDADEEVTLTCPEPECGETVTGPAKGQGSAPFKLASHKYRKHGIRSDGTVREPAKAKARRTESARPSMAVVRDITDPMQAGSGPPSESQLTNAGAHALQLLSLSVASLAAETEEDLTEAQRDEVTAYLALTKTQASEIVRPLAHLAQPTSINKRFGRTAVENVDAFAAVLELGELALHWRRYIRMRRARAPIQARVIDAASSPVAAPPTTPLTEQPHDPGGTAQTAEAVQTSGGAPGAGAVWTPGMVEEMRRRTGAERRGRG